MDETSRIMKEEISEISGRMEESAGILRTEFMETSKLLWTTMGDRLKENTTTLRKEMGRSLEVVDRNMKVSVKKFSRESKKFKIKQQTCLWRQTLTTWLATSAPPVTHQDM